MLLSVVQIDREDRLDWVPTFCLLLTILGAKVCLFASFVKRNECLIDWLIDWLSYRLNEWPADH